MSNLKESITNNYSLYFNQEIDLNTEIIITKISVYLLLKENN